MDFLENLHLEVQDENLTKAERLKQVIEQVMENLPLPAKLMVSQMMSSDFLCNVNDEKIDEFLVAGYALLDYIDGEE